MRYLIQFGLIKYLTVESFKRYLIYSRPLSGKAKGASVCSRPAARSRVGLGMGSGWAPCTTLDPPWANLMKGEANFTHGRPLPLFYSMEGWPSDFLIQGAREVQRLEAEGFPHKSGPLTTLPNGYVKGGHICSLKSQEYPVHDIGRRLVENPL